MRVVLFLCGVLITLGVNLGGCASGTNHSGGTVHKQNESWDFGEPRSVQKNDKFIAESGPASRDPSVKGTKEMRSPDKKQESETGKSVDSSAKTKSSKKKGAPPPPPTY